jgi:hypothetical protein
MVNFENVFKSEPAEVEAGANAAPVEGAKPGCMAGGRKGRRGTNMRRKTAKKGGARKGRRGTNMRRKTAKKGGARKSIRKGNRKSNMRRRR